MNYGQQETVATQTVTSQVALPLGWTITFLESWGGRGEIMVWLTW